MKPEAISEEEAAILEQHVPKNGLDHCGQTCSVKRPRYENQHYPEGGTLQLAQCSIDGTLSQLHRCHLLHSVGRIAFSALNVSFECLTYLLFSSRTNLSVRQMSNFRVFEASQCPVALLLATLLMSYAMNLSDAAGIMSMEKEEYRAKASTAFTTRKKVLRNSPWMDFKTPGHVRPVSPGHGH
eukprot:Gb_40700 [translate_table: standard]